MGAMHPNRTQIGAMNDDLLQRQRQPSAHTSARSNYQIQPDTVVGVSPQIDTVPIAPTSTSSNTTDLAATTTHRPENFTGLSPHWFGISPVLVFI